MNNLNTIEIKNLTVKYDNLTAINDISLVAKKGDFIGIIGPNGGGKSTLVKAIMNLKEKSAGEIIIDNSILEDNYNNIRYVAQSTDLNKSFPITVREVVLQGNFSCGLHPFHFHNKSCKKSAISVEEQLKINSLSNRTIDTLSGGEFQRLLIARALISSPEIIILDESTSNVDELSKEIIFSLMKDISKDKTILMITHDIESILKYANRIIILDKRILYDGDTNISISEMKQIYSELNFSEKRL